MFRPLVFAVCGPVGGCRRRVGAVGRLVARLVRSVLRVLSLARVRHLGVVTVVVGHVLDVLDAAVRQVDRVVALDVAVGVSLLVLRERRRPGSGR